MIKYLILACIALCTYSIYQSSTFWALCALVLLVAGATILANYKRAGALGWTLAIPAFYILYFVVYPILQQELEYEDFGRVSGVDTALLWAAGGLACFALGTIVTWVLLGRPSASRASPRELRQTRSFGFVCILVGLGLGAQIYSMFYGYYGLTSTIAQTSEFAGVFNAFSSLFELGAVLAWLQYFSRPSKKWLVLAGTTLSTALVFALFSKAKGAFVFPFIFLAGAYLLVRKRLPTTPLAIAAAMYFLFAYPFVTAWRQAGQTDYGSRGEQLEEGFEVLVSGDWLKQDEDATEHQGRTIGRGLLRVFSIIVSDTGRYTPFEEGETYKQALGILVPRFIYPEKPSMDVGHKVGVKYRIIQDHDERTNIAPTIMGEMFMNFGGLGVLIGMLIWGVLAAWVDFKLKPLVGNWFAAWTWPLALFGQEAALAHLVVPFVKNCLIVGVFFLAGGYLLATNKRQRGQAPQPGPRAPAAIEKVA